MSAPALLPTTIPQTIPQTTTTTTTTTTATAEPYSTTYWQTLKDEVSRLRLHNSVGHLIVFLNKLRYVRITETTWPTYLAIMYALAFIEMVRQYRAVHLSRDNALPISPQTLSLAYEIDAARRYGDRVALEKLVASWYESERAKQDFEKMTQEMQAMGGSSNAVRKINEKLLKVGALVANKNLRSAIYADFIRQYFNESDFIEERRSLLVQAFIGVWRILVNYGLLQDTLVSSTAREYLQLQDSLRAEETWQEYAKKKERYDWLEDILVNYTPAKIQSLTEAYAKEPDVKDLLYAQLELRPISRQEALQSVASLTLD